MIYFGCDSQYMPIGGSPSFRARADYYLMMLQAYFDGSGVDSDPNCTHVTLGAICARADEWEIFERRWEKTLIDHHAPRTESGIPYWHTVEATGRNGGYRGWEIEQVRELMTDLFKVIRGMPLDTIIMPASTIRLADYEAAKAQSPGLYPHKAISVIHCISYVLQQLKDANRKVSRLGLFFDRNEGYAPYVRKMESRGLPWTKRINGITDNLDAKEVYPLQGCDLIAWLLSRYHSGRERHDWDQFTPALTLLAPLCHVLYDKSTLKAVFDDDGNYRDKFHVSPTPLGCRMDYLIKWKELLYD